MSPSVEVFAGGRTCVTSEPSTCVILERRTCVMPLWLLLRRQLALDGAPMYAVTFPVLSTAQFWKGCLPDIFLGARRPADAFSGVRVGDPDRVCAVFCVFRAPA